MNNLNMIYFSGTNITKDIVEKVTGNINTYLGLDGNKNKSYNLLEAKIEEKLEFNEDDILVVGAPVYFGRIPKIMNSSLNNLKGNNTKAIAIITYGNREYDDALLELVNLLERQGFQIIGAAAIIGKHSIFYNVAKDRPNKKDLEIIDEFTKECVEKINSNKITKLEIPGSEEYRDIGNVPLKPKGDKKCTTCGICSRICPVNAINVETLRKTDGEICISCGACIHNCPEGARGYSGTMYSLASKKFEKDNSFPKEIEIFV